MLTRENKKLLEEKNEEETKALNFHQKLLK